MKRMKDIAALAAASALIFSACNKFEGPQAELSAPAGETLLSVNFCPPATKVAAQTDSNEKMIRNVQIFVFRGGNGGDAGNLEVAVSAGFDQELDVSTGSYNGITVKCSTGEREIWAVVNDALDHTAGPDAVATKDDFLALTHDLKDARKDKLLMVGTSGPRMLHEGREDVEIEVRRMAASVILETVTQDFSSPAYQKSGVFRVEDCYLLNVPGRVNFGGTTEASTLPTESWYARMEGQTTLSEGIIYDRVTPKLLNYGDVDTTPHAFYAYPNACAPSEDASWCPRSTLLVLEASVFNGHDWQKYYYPVSIAGGLEANKQYHVNLIIHRPGTLDVNRPVKFEDVTSVVRVCDWDSGDRYDQDI
jgi:hypothetical protein